MAGEVVGRRPEQLRVFFFGITLMARKNINLRAIADKASTIRKEGRTAAGELIIDDMVNFAP